MPGGAAGRGIRGAGGAAAARISRRPARRRLSNWVRGRGRLAAALIGPTPRSDILAALGDSLDWHAAHEGASPNAILNACRAWRYALTGAWSTKEEAADWALRRGAERGPIEAAVAARAGR